MLKMIMTLGMVFGIGTSVFAQQERKIIREGNDLFHKNDFEKAEVEYRKALEAKDDSYAAAFNLGDALYKQKKYEEALEQFEKLAVDEKDKERLGELYHNIGNTFLAMNKPEESIAAYKQSLLNRPTSQETKYNLEFARQQLQQQQQQQQQQQNQNQDQNQDNKEQNQNNQQQQNQNQDQQQNQQNQNQQNQDKNQQEQNKDQQNQNKDKQDQQKDQQQGQDKQDQNQQQQQGGEPQEGKISKEDAERLLEALENDEKETQEKVQKQKAEVQQAKKMKIEKNW